MGYKRRLLTRMRTLDSQVSRLRLKLERDPNDHFLVNVWGGGLQARRLRQSRRQAHMKYSTEL